MQIFAVVADTAGAWEAECVYSVWSTRDAAQREVARLVGEDVECGCYGGDWHIVPVMVDEPSDAWIGEQLPT